MYVRDLIEKLKEFDEDSLIQVKSPKGNVKDIGRIRKDKPGIVLIESIRPVVIRMPVSVRPGGIKCSP